MGGGLSAFLSRFSSSGVLLWGTYYHATVGIAGAPHLFEDIACDASGNVYAATGSGINSPYLVTPNAFQTQSNGNGDALLVKFNPSGQRLWATYYGGSATETAYGVACDNDQNVYITGQTGSLSDIATPGSWQSSCNNCQGGQSDGFLAKFDSSGNRIWATYFGGPSGDVLWRVKCDADDNVHAVGHTISFSDIASPGCHQPVHGNPLNPSQFDGMLIKFDSAGQRLWSTYYGGEGYDSFGDIAVKDNRRVYLAGVTTSNSNIATDTMYATPPNSIYSHMFLAEFDSSGQRIYATYYGGANHDGASSVAYSLTAGHIYMAGVSASANLATAGSYQVNNNLGPGTQAYDGLIVCFHDSSSTLNTPTVGGLLCTGSSYNIINNAVGYFGPGNSFTVQLSDPSGSFSNPTVIGSSNTTTGGVISCFIPAGISPGLNYRIRIVSSHPIAYSTVSGSIQIAHPTSAVVSITVSPGSAVPAGAAVTFTATVTNGGSAPYYNWKKNNLIISGATASTYTTNAFLAGDTFSVQVLSSEACALPVQSNQIVLQVINSVYDLQSVQAFSLSPNPFEGSVTIDCGADVGYVLSITDLTGRRVYSKCLQGKHQTVQLNQLSPGMYFYQIVTAVGNKQSGKMLKR